jgi:hypothetical protein
MAAYLNLFLIARPARANRASRELSKKCSGRAVNFEQIPFANGRMLDLTEALAQRGRAFNSTF